MSTATKKKEVPAKTVTALVLKTVKADMTAYGGCVVLTEWIESEKRYRVVVGYAGENGIEAGKWYQAKDGKLVETDPPCSMPVPPMKEVAS